MAIVVEDGSKVSGANSYISEAGLTAYATARGITITGDTEELLIKAMDYLEGKSFIGIKVYYDQALQWPRANAIIDGYLVATNEIPILLQDALCEIALSIDSGTDPLAAIDRLKDSVSVGSISVTYSQGQSTTLVRKISNKLSKLVKSSGGAYEVTRS